MPSGKKDRSKQKKQAEATASAAASAASAAVAAVAAAPKRESPFAAVHAAAARLKAANAVPELSKGLEAFLSIDLPADTSGALLVGETLEIGTPTGVVGECLKS